MQKIIAFFRLIRIANLTIIALSLALFYYCIIMPVHFNILHTTLIPFSNRDFALFVLSVILITAAGNIINDYYDFELDRTYKPARPLATDTISLNEAIYLHAAFALAGIGLGFYLGWSFGNFKIGYVYVICAVVLYLYSAYLKKIPLAGNLVVAGLTGFVFVIPVVFDAAFLNMIDANNLFENTGYAFNVLVWQMRFYGGFAFMTNLVREIVKDLEDSDGDAAFNLNTFAVAYGTKWAKGLALLLVLLLTGALAYFIYGFWNAGARVEYYYLGFVLALPLAIIAAMLFLAKTGNDYKRISVVLKCVMLSGVLSIFVFYYFNRVKL